MTADYHTFPADDIDPRDKGFSWILQYCKAAWSVGSNSSFSCFYNNAVRYREIREYALGKQSVSKYKLQNHSDRLTDKTSYNRDATVTPIIPQFRNKSLAKLLQRKFDINAFAVDEKAQTEQDVTLNELRIKIAMREAFKQVESPLSGHASVAMNPGEPMDEEQLNMMLNFGWKHNICMSAEMAIDWAFNFNKLERERSNMIADMYDFGAGGYKVYMDENGKPRIRSVNLDNLVVSYCEEPDFSDATFIGEAIYVNVSDLVPYFTAEQIKTICGSVAGMYNNPQTVNFTVRRYYDKFKVLVLDLQFISYDSTVYQNSVDKYGNPRFSKTDFKNASKIPTNGEGDPVYISKTKKVIYQAKWIVGQDLMYDYGLARNQVRKLSSWWDTQFDFVLESWNFDKMQFAGITEGLIPLADDYYQTQQKLQNIKRKLIPYLIEIDLDGLESVDYGAAGQKFTPAEIIDLLFQSHILVYRGKDLMSNGNQIAKPASIEATGMINELVMLRNEMQAIKQDMMEMSGYNNITVGNPNPKVLSPGYDIANTATNDSLWLVSEADKRLTLRLADLVIQKIQIAVKIGKIEGYSMALGDSVVKMFSLNEDISYHEFAIFLEDSSSQLERQQLIADLNNYNQQGLLEPQDRIMIEYCRNMKYAQMLLSYLVGKRKIEQQQVAQQQMQQNAQVQQQSALQSAQLQEQAAQANHARELELVNAQGNWNYQVAALKGEGTQSAAQISGNAKIVTQQIIEDNKGKKILSDEHMHKQKLAYSNQPTAPEPPQPPSTPSGSEMA